MPQYLSPEEIQSLRDNLTMLDVYRARKAPDRSEIGLQAYYNGALRLGLIEEGTDLDGFLLQLRTEDFNRIISEDGKGPRDPLASLPNGGEIEPGSSNGTDTPQESSSL